MFTIIVMLSPLSKIRPTVFRVPFFLFISSASSSTRFMYSSKPWEGRTGTSEVSDAGERIQKTKEKPNARSHGEQTAVYPKNVIDRFVGRAPLARARGKIRDPGACTHDDATLHDGIGVLVEPDLDPRLRLQKPEDEVLWGMGRNRSGEARSAALDGFARRIASGTRGARGRFGVGVRSGRVDARSAGS